MIKRIIQGICLSLAFALTNTVAFANVKTFNNDTITGSYSGNVGISKELNVNAVLLSQGKTYVNAPLSESMYYEQLTSREDGSFSRDFGINSRPSVSGWYNIWVISDKEPTPDEALGRVYILNDSDYNAVLSAFSVDTGDTLLNDFVTYTTDKKVLELALSSNHSDVCNIFASSRKGKYLTLADVISDYKICDKIDIINNTSADLMASVLDEFSDDNKYYSQKRTEISGKLAGDINANGKLKSIEDFYLRFKSLSCLEVINSETEYSKVTDIIKYYSDILDVDTNAYSTISETYINKYLIGKNFTDIESIEEAFKNAVNDYDTDDDDNDKNNLYVKPSSGGGGFSASNFVPVQSASVFFDIANVTWAKEAIEYLYNNGVISGDGSGNFRPNDYVTREEFVKMIIEAFDIPVIDGITAFTDVDATAWYNKYIYTAYNTGLTKGRSDTAFGIGCNITREDMAVFILRALEKSGYTLSKGSNGFADSADVSPYALKAVNTLKEEQILTGNGNNLFLPKNNSTRAEAAKIIYSALISMKG